jgi:molecular chaperone GrpE (heat shock protein)
MIEETNSEQCGNPEDNPGGTETDSATALREQLEEALREKDQFRAMAQRAQADLVNYRRRATDELEEARRNSNERLLLKIIGIMDDLDRALSMIPADAVAPGWLDGLQLVRQQFESILNTEGVSKIAAQGQPFEPWVHEAVFFEETNDAEEGTVVKVIRDGYKIHDRVLRAAQVAISKHAEPGNQSGTAQ